MFILIYMKLYSTSSKFCSWSFCSGSTPANKELTLDKGFLLLPYGHHPVTHLSPCLTRLRRETERQIEHQNTRLNTRDHLNKFINNRQYIPENHLLFKEQFST